MHKLIIVLSCLICLTAAGRLGVERKWQWWNTLGDIGQDKAMTWQGEYEYDDRHVPTVHRRQKFILDVLLQVHRPLVHSELMKMGQVLITDVTKYEQPIDEHLVNFWRHAHEHVLVDHAHVYNEWNVEHAKQLVGVYKFLVLPKHWTTFQHNVVFARIHMHPVIFVTALHMAIRDRADTQDLVMPAIHEVLPQLFYDMEVISTARQVDWEHLITKTSTVKPNWSDVLGMRVVGAWTPSWLDSVKSGVWHPWQEWRMRLAGSKRGSIAAHLGTPQVVPVDVPTGVVVVNDKKTIVVPVVHKHPMSYILEDPTLHIFWQQVLNERMVQKMTGRRQQAIEGQAGVWNWQVPVVGSQWTNDHVTVEKPNSWHTNNQWPTNWWNKWSNNWQKDWESTPSWRSSGPDQWNKGGDVDNTWHRIGPHNSVWKQETGGVPVWRNVGEHGQKEVPSKDTWHHKTQYVHNNVDSVDGTDTWHTKGPYVESTRPWSQQYKVKKDNVPTWTQWDHTPNWKDDVTTGWNWSPKSKHHVPKWTQDDDDDNVDTWVPWRKSVTSKPVWHQAETWTPSQQQMSSNKRDVWVPWEKQWILKPVWSQKPDYSYEEEDVVDASRRKRRDSSWQQVEKVNSATVHVPLQRNVVNTVDTISPTDQVVSVRSGEMFVHNLQQMWARIQMEKISWVVQQQQQTEASHTWPQEWVPTHEMKMAVHHVVQQVSDIIDEVIQRQHINPHSEEVLKVIGDVLVGNSKVSWGNAWDEVMTEMQRVVQGVVTSATNWHEPINHHLLGELVHMIDNYKQQLEPYHVQDVNAEHMHVENVHVDKLVTYLEIVDGDLINVVDQQLLQTHVDNVEKVHQKVVARQQRLNHEPFTISIDIRSAKQQDVVVRTFLMPKVDMESQPLTESQQHVHYWMLDAFVKTLQPGENHVQRHSHRISWTTPDVTTLSVIYKYVMTGQPLEDLVGTNGHFPHHLLLPRGTTRGMPVQLIVVVTPVSPQDEVLQQVVDMEHVGGLGVAGFDLNHLPLGFPMDRHVEQVQMLPNVVVHDTVIQHDAEVHVAHV